MDGEDIYKRPPILFGHKEEEADYLSIQDRITKRILEATESKTVTEFLVKLAYGENFHLPARLLDTKIEARQKEVLDLADAIEQIRSYNNFCGPNLASELHYLHDLGCIMDARFGREGSPVIYLSPPYWSNQASNHTENQNDKPRQYNGREREVFKKEIYRSLVPLVPDELHETELDGIRAWWD